MSDTERLIVTVRRMSADGRAEALVASADRRVVDATLRAVAKLADRPAGDPKPTRSIGDWYRQRHQDLDDLTDVELGKEIYLARLRRALDHDPDRCVWLWGREQACRAELDLRRRMPTEPQRAVHSCTPAHRERHMNERPAPKRVRIVDGKVVPQ